MNEQAGALVDNGCRRIAISSIQQWREGMRERAGEECRVRSMISCFISGDRSSKYAEYQMNPAWLIGKRPAHAPPEDKADEKH